MATTIRGSLRWAIHWLAGHLAIGKIDVTVTETDYTRVAVSDAVMTDVTVSEGAMTLVTVSEKTRSGP